jgi:hypothetical protein
VKGGAVVLRVQLEGDADLVQVRQAGGLPSGLLGPAQGRCQQRGEQAHDRHDHQQFHEGEAPG